MEPELPSQPQSVRAVLHDVNNLLGAILGLAAYIESLETSDDEIKESAQAILTAAETAAAITTNFLSDCPREFRPVDVHALLRDMMALIRPTTPASIRTHLSLAATHSSVRGDPAQLMQVLLNLAINAREAMPDGGDFTVETANRGSTELRIQFKDTGRGIPREMQALVFQPAVTTKSDRRGSGLGLSIVKGVVEAHAGKIGLDSEPGKGCSFLIRLPVT